jgi:hypothetical protein
MSDWRTYEVFVCPDCGAQCDPDTGWGCTDHMKRKGWAPVERQAVILDDFEAAVERGASAVATSWGYNPNAMDPQKWNLRRDDFERASRAALEAALTTPESENSDG